MSLGIQQAASYAQDGRWNWSVWIDGPDAELDQVESVEWVLHPTFTPPIVLVKERRSKFRLDTSGWGEFEINAHVTTGDGHRQHLKHWLRLSESGDAPAKVVPYRRPAVFISAGAADAGWEDAVRDAFDRRGFNVLTASDVPAGVPVEEAITSTIDKADTVVGIFSDKSGPWAEREVMKAIEMDVSVVPVAVGSSAKIPAGLGDIQAVRISHLGEVDAAMGKIADRFR
jgi:hypothetical protein